MSSSKLYSLVEPNRGKWRNLNTIVAKVRDKILNTGRFNDEAKEEEEEDEDKYVISYSIFIINIVRYKKIFLIMTHGIRSDSLATWWKP